MSKQQTEITLSRPLISGMWLFLPVFFVVNYGFVNGILNDYSVAIFPFILSWVMAPLFLMKKTLKVGDKGESITISEDVIIANWTLKSSHSLKGKNDLELIQEKYLGKSYYVIKGQDLFISLYGFKDKQYECFRALFDN